MITLKEEKEKTLALIEELNPDSPLLTDDPDIAAKINYVFNQVMFELCRHKKLPRFVAMPVAEGTVVTFADIEKVCGYEVYQVAKVEGVRYDTKADGTVFKMLETGTAEMDVYVFPERITKDTQDSYEFELSPDVLEIMPYGVAADLLKSDVSAEYGSVYERRYRDMVDRLDPRYSLPTVTFEGGVDV